MSARADHDWKENIRTRDGTEEKLTLNRPAGERRRTVESGKAFRPVYFQETGGIGRKNTCQTLEVML